MFNLYKKSTGNVHKKLRRILMSENEIQSLEKGSFNGLEHVEKVSLSNNNLRIILEKSFMNLPMVQSVFLDGNKIKIIQPGAFYNLTSLTSVYLQRNRLNKFSMENFSISPFMDGIDESNIAPSNLYVNVSYNEITTLDLEGDTWDIDESTSSRIKVKGGGKEGEGRIRILDLSHNKISRIEPLPYSMCGKSLLSLHLSFNDLSSLSLDSFSNCSSNLELLTLDNNVISCLENNQIHPGSRLCQKASKEEVGKGQVAEEDAKGIKGTNNKNSNLHLMPSLRVLSLSHNLLTDFQMVKSTFLTHSPLLTVLDLSYNKLQTVTGFSCETIQKLILSGNQLTQVQINYNSGSGRNSLRLIDLSHNLLRDIPDTLYMSSNLSSLDISYNRINDLSDATFSEGNQLKELFLTGNRIRNMKSRSLIPLIHLETLDMSECGLSQVTEFPLGQLQDLRLNGNGISNISSYFLSKSRRVKRLDLSRNLFPDVPRNLWRFVPGLVHLNISSNPIEVLDTTSLSNLLKLRSLDISRLSLKYIDTRILHPFK